MENVNDNNYGNIVKIQKYQCWKCHGGSQRALNKGYIELIPYQS